MNISTACFAFKIGRQGINALIEKEFPVFYYITNNSAGHFFH